MTQSELNRLVARASGEDRDTIAARGFSLVEDELPIPEDDLALFVDWDQAQAERNTSVLVTRGLAVVA